jgi:hypothetical protein
VDWVDSGRQKRTLRLYDSRQLVTKVDVPLRGLTHSLLIDLAYRLEGVFAYRLEGVFGEGWMN